MGLGELEIAGMVVKGQFAAFILTFFSLINGFFIYFCKQRVL